MCVMCACAVCEILLGVVIITSSNNYYLSEIINISNSNNEIVLINNWSSELFKSNV